MKIADSGIAHAALAAGIIFTLTSASQLVGMQSLPAQWLPAITGLILPDGRAGEPGARRSRADCARIVRARAPKYETRASSVIKSLGGSPGQRAEARGFEPRKGANPNRISSAAP